MARLFKKGGRLKLVVACTLVIVMIAGMTQLVLAGQRQADYVYDGNVGNHNHQNAIYNTPLEIRKTVTSLGSKNFELSLTANGYNYADSKPREVYAVFVIDKTSSMGQLDIPVSSDQAAYSDDPGDWKTRSDATIDAVNAYIEVLFGGADAVDDTKHVAIVTYGNSARVHVPTKDGYPLAEKNAANDTFIGFDKNDTTDKGIMTYSYDEAVALQDSFEEIYSDTSSLFFSSAETVTNMVNATSGMRNTNIESGMLMAEFLLENVPESDAVDTFKYVFLITDGEANASSTFAALESKSAEAVREGLLNEAKLIHTDETDPQNPVETAVEVDGTPIYSFEKIMANLSTMAANPGTLHDNVTPCYFAGQFHSLDRSSSYLSGASNTFAPTSKGFHSDLKLSDIDADAPSFPTLGDGYTEDNNIWTYFKAVDKFIVANKNSDDAKVITAIQKYNEYIQELAFHCYWTAETRTDYSKPYAELNGYQTVSKSSSAWAPLTPLETTGERIFETFINASNPADTDKPAFGMSFADLFPEGKAEVTQMRDYRENTEPMNASGSDAARVFLQQSGERLQAEATVYTIGVGNIVLYEDTLNQLATSGIAIFCRAHNDVAGTAADLAKHFRTIAFDQAGGVTNLVITDAVPIRTGPAETNDGTFTVNKESAKLLLYYFDENGEPTTQEVDASNLVWTEKEVERRMSQVVSWSVGNLFSIATSQDKKSVEFPYKAELIFKVTCNNGVYSTAGAYADIATNVAADVQWGVNHEYEMDYPKPLVYIPSELANFIEPEPEDKKEEEEEEPEEEEPEPEPVEEPEPGPDPEPEPPKSNPILDDGTEIPPPGNTDDDRFTFVDLGDGQTVVIDTLVDPPVPLGTWTWDDEAEEWLFDENVPLSFFGEDEMEAPATGDDTLVFGVVMIAALAGIGLVLISTSYDGKRRQQ